MPMRRTPTMRWGSAGRVDDGRVVTGCNVENASYGVALCAECGMVSQLHITGGGGLTHAVCVNGRSEVIMPCGRCRQLLMENGGPELLLLTVSGVRRMDEVLPDAFRSRRPRLTWATQTSSQIPTRTSPANAAATRWPGTSPAVPG